MNWREQKRSARDIVHDHMAVPCDYYATKGAEAVRIRARLHLKFDALGDDRSMGWAEIQAMKPKLVFRASEVDPARGAVIYFQPGEAYRVDNLLPPDDQYIIAEVSVLSTRQLEIEGLPTGEAP